MEVHLSQNQESQLNELATRTGRGTDDLMQEAVAHLLAHDNWFKKQVQVGIDQIAAASCSKKKQWTTASSGYFILEAQPLPPLTSKVFVITCGVSPAAAFPGSYALHHGLWR